MTTLSRTKPLLAARILLGFGMVGLALLYGRTARDVFGQAPGRAVVFAQKKPRVEEEEKPAKTPPKKKRVEEEEDSPKRKPKRKPLRVEGDDEAKAKPETAPADVPAAGDLGQLSEQTAHSGAKLLFLELAVPHDLLIFKRLQRVTSGSSPIKIRKDEVEPVPFFPGNDPARYPKEYKFQRQANGGNDKPFSPPSTSIDRVQIYEEIAWEKVHEFLEAGYDRKPRTDKNYLSRFDMLTTAEQALSAVLRWHESARLTGQRGGKEWERVESGLRKHLLDDVLLKQMDLLVKARDWDRLLALTRRLLETYPDKADRESISRPVAGLLQATLSSDPTVNEEQQKQARKRLRDLAAEFPDNRVFLRLGDELRKKAQSLLDHARRLGLDKNNRENQGQIDALLKQAEDTWQLRELHEYKLQRSVDHPVLRVGVRGELPKYFSPGWATTDTERRAVDLLFESLVKLVPDETGAFRYRPELAEQRPKVVPLGRHFQLPRHASWSNGEPLNSSDIRFTLGLLKSGVALGRSRAWGELFDQIEARGDAYQVTLRLHQGFLDPLALMTFKVLPSHRSQVIDTETFAKNPVGSGPFRLDPDRRSDDSNRECVFFVANPAYGTRPGKHDRPSIQEIRFYSYGDDPVKELSAGKLDMVLDLTAKEAAELQQKADVEVPTPTAPNRRIYFLAINHAKLPDAKLRKALAYAVNREELLNKHFRGPFEKKIHKVLNGPFPAGSWACNPDLVNRHNKGSLDLFDAEAARTLSPKASVGPLSLKYPRGDAVLEAALKDLCDQVKDAIGMTLKLSPCDPGDLRRDVERTQSYDLAYYHYDFPDETYWLWPLLGPRAAASGDGNVFKFMDGTIQQTLKAATDYRNFAEVQKNQWAVHALVRESMPFVPLWQLDPLMAYGRVVKPAVVDPLLVFGNVEEWRLQRK